MALPPSAAARTADCRSGRGALARAMTLAAVSFGLSLQAEPAHGKPPKPRPAQRDAGAPANDSPFAEVREHMRSGDRESALKALDALPPSYGQSSQARYLRARIPEKQERTLEALDTLPEDLNSVPPIVARDIQIR